MVNWYTPDVHNYLASAMTSTVTNISSTNVISSLYVLKAGPTVTVGPVDPLGIEDAGNAETTFAVFPNPACEGVVIHLTKALNHARIKLYDANSKLVMEFNDVNGTDYKIDRKGLANGIYFFSLEETGNTFRGRIIFD